MERNRWNHFRNKNIDQLIKIYFIELLLNKLKVNNQEHLTLQKVITRSNANTFQDLFVLNRRCCSPKENDVR